jgi:hypothetical protein
LSINSPPFLFGHSSARTRFEIAQLWVSPKATSASEADTYRTERSVILSIGLPTCRWVPTARESLRCGQLCPIPSAINASDAKAYRAYRIDSLIINSPCVVMDLAARVGQLWFTPKATIASAANVYRA